MSITKEKLDEIRKRYRSLLVLDADAEEALNFAHDLLEAEADAVKAQEPYAVNTIQRLEAAAYEVFSLAQEIAEVVG